MEKMRSELLTSPVAQAIGIAFLAVAASRILVHLWPAGRGGEDLELARRRLKAWYVVIWMFALAVVVGLRTGVLWFFGFVSFLALKEFFTLIPTRRVDRTLLFYTYLAVPLQYYWVASKNFPLFVIFVPVVMFMFLPIHMVLTGDPKGYLRAAGTLHWGLMTTVFSLSHAAYLVVLPEGDLVTGIGWLFLMVLLTQLNDLAHQGFGKWLGGKPVARNLTHRRTWPAFVGGVLTTVVLAMLLGPLLTPLQGTRALFAGVIIAVGGFFGDVSIMALNRDLNLKDETRYIPGHGGILDRVDSLTYTAPLFFHYVNWVGP